MEKLIELLNEYEKKKKSGREREVILNMLNIKGETFVETTAVVISKEYGFIKWLVENDKIDRDKFNYCRDNFFDTRYYGFSTHQYILMLLSIRENPIEFLVSILK